MDTLSHGLWALAIYWGTPYRWWAFLVGMVPDLLSFGLVFTKELGHLNGGPPPIESLPSWLSTMYTITHSAFTWVVISALLFVVARKYWLIAGAGLAHVGLDTVSHSCRYFPTPFLEPLSNYRYCGISWATPWLYALNWISLALLFGLIGYYEWSLRKKS